MKKYIYTNLQNVCLLGACEETQMAVSWKSWNPDQHTVQVRQVFWNYQEVRSTDPGREKGIVGVEGRVSSDGD